MKFLQTIYKNVMFGSARTPFGDVSVRPTEATLQVS